MEIINVTDEIIEINVTEAVVNIVTQTGAYPLPSNVFSVFGRVGNVVGQVGDYTTSLVTEGTNLYYTDARSRAAISENITGINYDSASGIFSMASGYAIATTASQDTWDAAYNDKINSASVTGTATKTLTLNQQDGGTITASWSDADTGLTSVGLSMPAAFSVSGSPLTSNGTIAVTGSGTTAQYVRGDGTLASFPSLTGFVPYTGATGNVNLGTHSLTAADLVINHTSGSGVAASITKGGNGEAISVVKTSGSGNAASITGGVTLLDELHLTTDLADAYIASASNWNTAYTNRITSASAPLSIAANAISISQANTTTNGFLSSTDWNTFNNKQAAGNYITALTGEATASGPGSASVTLTNSAVTGKVLTGLNITGGSVSATDSILNAFGKVQNQINGLIGGSIFQSVWNASTNTPTLTSSVGTKGYYYIVDVSGTTNLNGITDWKVGDWAIYDGTAWQKVDNTDAVSSVNGFTGAVSLTTANISEATNLYYTDARARAAITLTTTGTSGAATYSGGTLNIPQYQGVLTNPVTGTGTTNTLPKFTGTSAIGNSNITDTGSLITLGSNSYVNGALGIGTASPSFNIDVAPSSGSPVIRAVRSGGADVRLSASVTATGGIVGTYTSSPFLFFINGAEVARFDINGALGIGSTSLTGFSLLVGKNLTGGTSVRGISQEGFVQSDATIAVYGIRNVTRTATASFTISDYQHFLAVQATLGAGSAITNQYGFVADSTLISGVNNFGFYGNIPAAANRWNLYMNGTANNYLAGSLGIGTTALTAHSLRISRNMTGATTARGVLSEGVVQSDVVTANYFSSFSSTAAATFSTDIVHYFSSHLTTGAGSTITSNTAFMTGNLPGTSVFGFRALSSLSGSSTTQAFRGDIASGTNQWNLYMNGTANNYLAGNLFIGATNPNGWVAGVVNTRSLTGGTSAYGYIADATIQSDVTNTIGYFRSQSSTAAASFTLISLNHFVAAQATFGAGSSVTTQRGFWAQASLVGATNDYGFQGSLPSGTNNWNLFMDGTANNYMAGSLAIGGTSFTQGGNTYTLNLTKNITGGVISGGMSIGGLIQSDVTSAAIGLNVQVTTAAAAFTLNQLRHISVNQTTLGVGSSVSNQYGIYVDQITNGTSNFGFFGNIPSGTNRWNLYMNGTAANFLAGRLGIGIASPAYDLDVFSSSANVSIVSNTNNNGFSGIVSTFNSAYGNFIHMRSYGNTTASTIFGISTNGMNALWSNNDTIYAIGTIGATPMVFGTNNTERMRITSGGSVGIGTSSPSALLHLSQSTTNLNLYLQNTSGSGKTWAVNSDSNGSFNIHDTAVNRLTITSDGWLKTRESTSSTTAVHILRGDTTSDAVVQVNNNSVNNGSDGMLAIVANRNTTNNTFYALGYYNSAAGAWKLRVADSGNITNTNGSYGTISSDIRLKENIKPATSKLDDLLKLNVVNFNLIGNEEKHIGFIAQEMQEVFPSFVYENDTRKYDEDGNLISGLEDALGVKVGMEFAILVKAIQELKAEIDELKNK